MSKRLSSTALARRPARGRCRCRSARRRRRAPTQPDATRASAGVDHARPRRSQTSSVARRRSVVEPVERTMCGRVARRAAPDRDASRGRTRRRPPPPRPRAAAGCARAAPPLAPPAPCPGCCTRGSRRRSPARRVAARSRAKFAHVDDEVAVAEEGAALGDGDVARCRPLAHLLHRAGHRLRRASTAPSSRSPACRCAPAATSRSVCRQRKAGIWSTSTTSAAGAACSGRWMSVSSGRPVAARTRSSAASPSSSPGPRAAPGVRRLALSKLALKQTGTRRARAEPRQMLGHAQAARRPARRTQGPAMRNGRLRERPAPSARRSRRAPAAAAPARRRAWRRSAAPMKPANSGCGRVGRDLSSGWNWQPMNQDGRAARSISTSPPSGDRPAEPQPVLGEHVAVRVADLVAVPVPLADLG